MRPIPEREFTPSEVLRMVEAGIIRDDEDVELIDGRLLVVMPQGPMHATLVQTVRAKLEARYGSAFHLREEKCIELRKGLPEPDVAVIRGGVRDYYRRHPRSRHVVLAVEVMVSSHDYDHWKAGTYARARIPVLWLLDVPRRRLEVHMEPRRGTYRVVRVLGDGETVTPPEASRSIAVRDLLEP